MTIFFFFLFSIWIALTIIKQFNKTLLFSFSKFDIFSLIPNWTLFAPNPKFSDYKVFYRDKFRDGTISDLIEIPFNASSFKSFLWKGQSRRQKFLSILCRDALNCKRKNIEHIFFHDIKVTMFKNFCKGLDKKQGIRIRQIIVIETFGYLLNRDERIIFVTDINYRNA